MDHEEKKEAAHHHEAAEATHAHHEHHEHHENHEHNTHEAVANESASDKKAKKFNYSILAFGLLGAIVVGFLAFYGVVLSQVKKLSQHSMIVRSAEILHIPAVKVNGETLLYSDYITDFVSLKKLSQNPALGFGGATDQDISDLVVANFLTIAKNKELANKLNVQVTPEEITAKEKEIFTQYGEEAVKKNIEESYGWSFEKFEQKILQPSILAAKVRDAFEKSNTPEATQFMQPQVEASHILFVVDPAATAKQKADQKKKAMVALARIKKGEDFAKVAKEVSEDVDSKELGGALGWIGKGKAQPSFEQAAFALEVGKVSEILETTYGFHIIKVTNKRSLPDFDAYMDSEMKKVQPTFSINIHNPLDTFNNPQAPVAAETQPAPAASTTTK